MNLSLRSIGSKAIDKSLNYGRHNIKSFLEQSGQFDSILDLGAGRGQDLSIANDVNRDAARHAVEAYQPYVEELRSQGVQVYPMNIEIDSLPFHDESMDVIMCNQLLEHVKEVYWIFHEISRVLRIGGKIILGVPNLASLHNRILLALGKQPTSIQTDSAHVRGYTKGDIIQFLESCFPGGYKLTAFKGSNFYPFPPSIAKPMANLFPSAAWGIFLMFEKTKEYNSQFIEYPIRSKLETNFYTGT